MSESCVLDPVEFIPERVELDLDSLGLAVRQEGVDWGEAAIQAQMVRRAEGESSSDGHRGAVQIRIPIRVKAEGAVSLAGAAHKLQQKVGTWQGQGGWVRRDFAGEGGFAGSIGYQILRHTAALSGLQGWLFAHRQDVPDVVLTAMRMPIGYRTDEREQGPFVSVPGERHLIFDEVASEGSGEGLWRGRFTNEGEEDLRGLILSRECLTAPDDLEDPTAQPHYLAKDLTVKGGAEVVAGPTEAKVRAVGAVASGTGAISPGLPAGTKKGDLLLMWIESGGATTGTEANTEPTATGWTLGATQKAGNTRLTVLYRIATGTDPTTTNDTGDHQMARIIGVEAGTFEPSAPINVTAKGTQAATKSVSIPGATTTFDNCLVFLAASGHLPDATTTTEFGAPTNAALTSLTERIDNTTTAGDGGALYVATGIKATKGAYGATTLTAVTEAERAVISLAINAPIYVEHKSLTAGWITVLESEIAGVGHMTHIGPRVPWLRIYDPGAEAGGVQLHLLCRALGASRWDESLPIVSTPVVGGWIPVRMGVARPELATLGDQRWEFKLLARAPSGSGAIRLRDVYPLSTEQYAVLSAPYIPPVADSVSPKSPGTVEDGTSLGTKAWGSPGNAKASDNAYATVTLPSASLSHYLVAKNFGFELPEDAIPLGIVATIERKASVSGRARDSHLRIMKGGVIGPGTHVDRADFSTFWPTEDSVASYGSSADTWGVNNWTPADINASDFGVALAVWAEGAEVTASVDQITLYVYYTDEVASDLVCFAGRSVELRSDGVVRQHPSDDVWGPLVPEGFLPTTPAGGLEGKSTRTIIVASSGDFEELPDGAPPSIRAVNHGRDGYHFARESA